MKPKQNDVCQRNKYLMNFGMKTYIIHKPYMSKTKLFTKKMYTKDRSFCTFHEAKIYNMRGQNYIKNVRTKYQGSYLCSIPHDNQKEHL